jgi:prepilin signal peptidase PulO-like enzyme (type II secretory pathway)
MYKKFGWIFIICGIVIIIGFTVFGNYVDFDAELSPEMLSKYGGFIGGTVGVLFSLAGYFLIFEGLVINKKNQFENTFFNLVTSFNNFRTQNIGLEFRENKNETYQLKKGYEFFEIVMHKQINPYRRNENELNDTDISSNLKAHKSQLSQYYGQINMILYKIKESSLNENEKQFYIEYLQSILSEIEIFLINRYDLVFETGKFKYLKLLK